MAIIKCPECGNDVSDMANSCPKCGCPIKLENNVKATERSKEKKFPKALLIILIVIVLIAIAVGLVIFFSGRSSSTLFQKANETETPSKIEVTLTDDNFLDYFEIDVECARPKVESSPKYLLSTYDMSCDYTVIVKAKQSLECEDVYFDLDTGINADYQEIGLFYTSGEEVSSIHLTGDGYFNGTYTCTFSPYTEMTFCTSDEEDREISNVSGKIYIEK